MYIKKIRKIIVLFMVILLIATPLLAQQEMSEYFQGKQNGEEDAKGSNIWLLSGCIIGYWAILFAYLIEPDVPTGKLIGKSPEYVQGYTDGYKQKAKKKNVMNAIYGCVVGYTVGCILYIFLIALSSSSD